MALLQEVFVYESKWLAWPLGRALLTPAARGAFIYHLQVACYLGISL